MALRAVQPGFTDPDQVQLVRIAIPGTLVDDPERASSACTAAFGIGSQPFRASLRRRWRAQRRWNRSSATTWCLPKTETIAEGRPDRRFKFVSPGFFRTVGTPVVAGRDFQWTDLDQRRPVAVISENMAREMWREPAAALGKRIRENPEGPWREIVGVVGDVFDDGVHEPAPMTVYWPALMENF